jgi:glucosamine-phosphate N-acetyltransferase
MQMRPLSKTDLSRSHLSVLRVLTSTPDLTEQQYVQAFDAMRSCPNTYYTLVVISRETDTIVGVGSVFLEQKFTRNLGRVGHIEDIAVDKSMQGRKLGLRIIQALTGISERVGCYKTILNCSDENIREFHLFFVFGMFD